MPTQTEIRDPDWLDEAFERYSATKDASLRDEIARETSWLAVRAARRFADRGEPFDDLVQVAQIGLIKAIDRFDPTLLVPFGAYATPTILGEIRRHFRDHTWSLHVPRRAKDLRTAVNSMVEQLEGELARSPRIDEIAARLDTTSDIVLECLEANAAYKTRSLDLPGPVHASTDDGSMTQTLHRDVVAGLLDRLAPRERMILQLRFFDELSQSEIAARVGTSQVHVGRLIAASLASLRPFLEDHDDEVAT